ISAAGVVAIQRCHIDGAEATEPGMVRRPEAYLVALEIIETASRKIARRDIEFRVIGDQRRLRRPAGALALEGAVVFQLNRPVPVERQVHCWPIRALEL